MLSEISVLCFFFFLLQQKHLATSRKMNQLFYFTCVTVQNTNSRCGRKKYLPVKVLHLLLQAKLHMSRSISMEHNVHFKSSETNSIGARINYFFLVTLRLLSFHPAFHDEEWKQGTCGTAFPTSTDNHSQSLRVY